MSTLVAPAHSVKAAAFLTLLSAYTPAVDPVALPELCVRVIVVPSSKIKVTKVLDSAKAAEASGERPKYVAKTALGRAMLAARQRILDAGEKLTPASELMAALDKSRAGE